MSSLCCSEKKGSFTNSVRSKNISSQYRSSTGRIKKMLMFSTKYTKLRLPKNQKKFICQAERVRPRKTKALSLGSRTNARAR
jgi:hypothetical protein